MTDRQPDISVDFGYRRVAEDEKQDLVNEVFSKVADRYDQMNDLMSAGLHRFWKDHLVAMLNPARGAQSFEVLDVAGGTGDIAFRIAQAGGSGTKVVVADISFDMVSEGRRRSLDLDQTNRCMFTVCNAERLAFPDRRFDAYTIAFGIRNVTHIERALDEARRILKPGGRFLCLEFSTVDIPLLDKLYDAYSFAVIPAVGKVVAGDGHPYRYLVESIRKFPTREKFLKMLERAGFENVTCRSLSGGIVAIHSGWRI